ncbi:MAG: lactate racemase domain-containing protein, partial [Myxococcales bacterium]
MHLLHTGTGQAPLPPSFDAARVLAGHEPPPLADPVGTLRDKLLRPDAGPPLAALLGDRRKVTVVVPDATRALPVGLVEALLEALGDRPFAVRVANGTHRRATAAEQQRILGRFFGQVPHGDRHADDPFA